MHNEVEHNSAAHDGEGNAQDLLRMLDAIDSDPTQRKRDSLYYLIGDALRDPGSPALSVDVTSAVMRSVAREPVPAVPADAAVRPFRTARTELSSRHAGQDSNGAVNSGVSSAIHAAANDQASSGGANLPKPWWQTLARSAAAIAAVAFISGLVWRGTGVSDPVVAYVVFEQPRNMPQAVQMDSMPPELVEYLLAHRQNTVAGSMNAGSALIRANLDDPQVSGDRLQAQHPRAGDMEWVRLWDNRPVYVTPRAVER